MGTSELAGSAAAAPGGAGRLLSKQVYRSSAAVVALRSGLQFAAAAPAIAALRLGRVAEPKWMVALGW
jgi:hypothetical protein